MRLIKHWGNGCLKNNSGELKVMKEWIGGDTEDKSEDTLTFVEVEFVNFIALKLLEEFGGEKKSHLLI